MSGASPAQTEAVSFEAMHPLFWSAVSAFVITLLAAPIVRRAAIRLELYDRPDGGLKPHQTPIPYLGGIAIYAGWLAALLLSQRYRSDLSGSLWWIVLAGTLLMVTGLVDDLRHLRPRTRLLIQAVAAGLLLYTGIGRDVFSAPLELAAPYVPGWLTGEALRLAFGGLFCAFVIAGATNSTNLIDGLDGLCAGVLAIAFMGYMQLSRAMAGESVEAAGALAAIVAAGVIGACLGFLWYNFNPASIFMGDSGSLLLGFNAALMIIWFADRPTWRWMVGAILVFGFPILDTALAMTRRWLNGRPLFVGDRSHFYDQLRDRGLSVKQTVVACYLLEAAFVGLGLIAVRLPALQLVILVMAVPVVCAVFCWRARMLRVDDTARQSRTQGPPG